MKHHTTPLRRIEPSRHLYAGHKYVPADQTDIQATFDRLRLEEWRKEAASEPQEQPQEDQQ